MTEQTLSGVGRETHTTAGQEAGATKFVDAPCEKCRLEVMPIPLTSVEKWSHAIRSRRAAQSRKRAQQLLHAGFWERLTMTKRGADYLCYKLRMNHFVSAFALIALAAVSATGQEHPQTNATAPDCWSEARTLEGKLIFHDGIRQWIELRLDKPQCGQTSIEIFPWNSPQLQILRGCRVRSTGSLGGAASGYYTLDVNQTPYKIEPIGKCDLKAPFADYSNARPDKAIRAYRVEMHINAGLRDLPIRVSVSSSGKELRPWQAYASYFLTGGWVLYGNCGKGFVVDRVYGSREVGPSHLDYPRTPGDMATFFPPEKPVVSGVKDLNLGYSCIREK